jgi:hypothetical protein
MADQSQASLSLKTDLESSSLPPVAAAYLVKFDHRKGYVLDWHKSVPDVELEGVVEYKSLPSGLHNVEEDLVYFVHNEYAGLSAFINRKDEMSERSARMLAVGILIPLGQSHTGQSWRHAEKLKELARQQVEDPSDLRTLENFWETSKLSPEAQNAEVPPASSRNNAEPSSNGYTKPRTMSTATTYIQPHHTLTPYHPALALMDSIQLFGPLIFPLFRAALLRKRILIITDAPVESACNLVYNLSILSAVPKSLFVRLGLEDTCTSRLKALFVVGVADIPMLSQQHAEQSDRGFVACSTDDVLATKPELYDILVRMPRSDARNAAMRVFPQIIASGTEVPKVVSKHSVKATMRDASRFARFMHGLRRFTEDDEGLDSEHSLHSSQPSVDVENAAIIESASWSQIAYTSLVWWASAGDTRAGLAEDTDREIEQDLALLQPDEEGDETQEVAIVAYFHRLTAMMLHCIATAVARADHPGEYHDDAVDNDSGSEAIDAALDESQEDTSPLRLEEVAATPVEINHEDVIEMGLDTWSATDKGFVEELLQIWWGRKALVRPNSLECCGIRIL